MRPLIRLPKHQLSDLAVIREMDIDLLNHAIAELKQRGHLPMSASQIREVCQKIFGEGLASEAVVRQLLALHGLIGQLDLSIEQVFEGLDAGLESSESEWTPAHLRKWQSIKKPLRELLELEVVKLSAKALDLSYEHSELLRRVRILTDIRPVFSDDASQISGTVITHSLLLRYDDVEGDHVLTLAIDENDIQSLLTQCNRALKKSETAQRQLKNAGLESIIPGKGT